MSEVKKDLSVLNIMNLVLQVLSESGVSFINFGTNITDNTIDDRDSLQDFEWESDKWSIVSLRFLKESELFIIKVLQEPGKSITLMFNNVNFPIEFNDFDSKTFITKFKTEFIEKNFQNVPKKNPSFLPYQRFPAPNLSQSSGMIFNPFHRSPPSIDPLIPRPVVGARYDPIFPPIGRDDLYGPLPHSSNYQQQQPFPGQFRHLPQFGPGGLDTPPDFNEFM